MTPKQFPARVYEDTYALEAVTHGLGPAEIVLHSEPVAFDAEARVFVLEGEAIATGLYEGASSLDGRWVVIEANATWGAGLNGCDATAVVACVASATRSR